MILAAGRGERMRPLTDSTPKPLLEVRGKPLIVWQIEALARAGFRDIVVNLAHLGGQIEDRLGDGKAFGVGIAYSREESALETAGGIAHAMHLLGNVPFLAVNSDIYCDFDYSTLLAKIDQMANRSVLAHLVLVDNPEHHPQGDFFLEDGRIVPCGKEKLTFSGIGIYRPDLFHGIRPGQSARLAPLLNDAIVMGAVSGMHHRGLWIDVGTPERLLELNSGGRIGA